MSAVHSNTAVMNSELSAAADPMAFSGSDPAGRSFPWWGRWLSGTMVSAMSFWQMGRLLTWLLPPAGRWPEVIPLRPVEATSWLVRVVPPLTAAALFAGTYLVLRSRTNFPPRVRGGLLFGLGIFLAGLLPAALWTFAAVPVPTESIAWWLARAFVQCAVAGMLLGCVVDGARLQVTSTFPAAPERVWWLLLRKETFLYITRGMMSFQDSETWPETLMEQDVSLSLRLRLFDFGLWMPHHIRFVEVDPERRVIQTREQGGMIRLWGHRMTLEPDGAGGTRYTDRVDLEAAVLTPFVWLFARAFYRHRHRRWQEWLRAREGREPEAAAVS